MSEVITESLAWINLPFTVLLGMVLLYWITVIVGLADMDAGLDHDIDHDADADHDGHAGGGFLGPVLEFFYIGEVPVLIVLSVFSLAMWAFAVLANYYFNPSHSLLLALGLFILNLIVSGLVTRVVGAPLRQAFGYLNKDYDEHRAIVGRACVVTTSELTNSFGQATITEGAGAPIIVNARTLHDEVLRRGDSAIIFEEDKEKGLYFIKKLEPAPLET